MLQAITTATFLVGRQPWAAHLVETGRPWQSPVLARLAHIRRSIKTTAKDHGWAVTDAQLDDRHIVRRMILKKTIFGVDKNPMAVELAKTALWLHTFTVGAPLSFLDHHLKIGDSLHGEKLPDVQRGLQNLGALLLRSEFDRLALAAKNIAQVADLTDVDIAEAQLSKQLAAEAEAQVAPIHAVLDFWRALRWLVPGWPVDKIGKLPKLLKAGPSPPPSPRKGIGSESALLPLPLAGEGRGEGSPNPLLAGLVKLLEPGQNLVALLAAGRREAGPPVEEGFTRSQRAGARHQVVGGLGGRVAVITLKVYAAHPVLVRHGVESKSMGKQPDVTVWPVKYVTMFHMTNDSHLFLKADELLREGFKLGALNRWVNAQGKQAMPLYVGRMIHQHDHRHSSVTVNEENLQNAALSDNLSDRDKRKTPTAFRSRSTGLKQTLSRQRPALSGRLVFATLRGRPMRAH